MDLGSFKQYLNFPKVWIVGIVFVVLRDLFQFLNQFLGSENIFSSVYFLHYLFLFASIAYLSKEVETDMDLGLVIGFTYSAIAVIAYILTLVFYVVLVPEMISYGASQIISIPGVFFVSAAFYYLIENKDLRKLALPAYSIFIATILALITYIEVQGLMYNLADVKSAFMIPGYTETIIDGFLIVAGITLGLKKYFEYSKEEVVLVILLLYAGFSIIAQYAGVYFTDYLSLQMSFISLWPFAILVYTGVVYYSLVRLKEIYEY